MFDSGFGGLTVARALVDLLPNENLVYFADTARFPYGSRSATEVTAFASQITEMLITFHDPKMIVVACNTASAVSIGTLSAKVDVPVIGVLKPGLESLLNVTQTSRVGLIGTVGTVASGAYQRLAAELAPEVALSCAACPGFVEFVERGETDSDQLRVLAQRLLTPILAANVDALLLGCTHYPFLAHAIAEVMGREVVLVSSADETAFAVQRELQATGQAREQDSVGYQHFVSSGDSQSFAQLGRRLLGGTALYLDLVECHSW